MHVSLGNEARGSGTVVTHWANINGAFVCVKMQQVGKICCKIFQLHESHTIFLLKIGKKNDKSRVFKGINLIEQVRSSWRPSQQTKSGVWFLNANADF